MRAPNIFAVLFFSLIIACPTILSAQPRFGGGPPGGGFRGGPPGGGYSRDRGGSDRDRGGPPRGGFDPREMIRRMDENRNGQLDPNEISDRARPFLQRFAESSKLDLSRPVPLDKLFSAMDKRREEMERSRNRDRSSRGSDETDTVPGFEIDEELPIVPGFDLPADSPLLATGPLEDRYDREIMERIERALRYYDRNRDGILDAEEIKNGRWSDNPNDHDLNGDGKLSKVELAERYAKRYGNDKAKKKTRYSSSSSNSSSSSGSSSSKSTSSSSSNISRYADSLLRRYDSNKNGVLEKDEWKKMSNDPEKSDKNRDGKITRQELEARLKSYGKSSSGSKYSKASSRSRGSSSGSSNGTHDLRFTTLDERLAKMGLSGSSPFLKYDKNTDGQIQMSEYSYSWNEEKLREFQERDLNRDGIITPQEWLTFEKQGG